jgi:hypothetical protein
MSGCPLRLPICTCTGFEANFGSGKASTSIYRNPAKDFATKARGNASKQIAQFAYRAAEAAIFPDILKKEFWFN